MAIQDQIDRLNNEVDEQAAIIAEISDILATKAGGSGGGGSNTYWVSVGDLPTTYGPEPLTTTAYLDVPSEIKTIIGVRVTGASTSYVAFARRNDAGDLYVSIAGSTTSVHFGTVSGENNILAVSFGFIEDAAILLTDQEFPW